MRGKEGEKGITCGAQKASMSCQPATSRPTGASCVSQHHTHVLLNTHMRRCCSMGKSDSVQGRHYKVTQFGTEGTCGARKTPLSCQSAGSCRQATIIHACSEQC